MTQTEERINRALASEEFARAQRLWGDYVEELRCGILRGEATAGDLERAAELLELARLAVMAFKARAAGQLAQTQAASVYGREW